MCEEEEQGPYLHTAGREIPPFWDQDGVADDPPNPQPQVSWIFSQAQNLDQVFYLLFINWQNVFLYLISINVSTNLSVKLSDDVLSVSMMSELLCVIRSLEETLSSCNFIT